MTKTNSERVGLARIAITTKTRGRFVLTGTAGVAPAGSTHPRNLLFVGVRNRVWYNGTLHNGGDYSPTT
eukprot:scaffold528_cov165-Amphora_coffeaeformis.AAC.21